MRMLIATALLAAGTTSPALAANKCFDKATLTFIDCPEPFAPPAEPAPAPLPERQYDWTSWFIGGHVGFAAIDLSGGYDFDEPETLLASPLDVDGLTLGAQIGYDWDFGDYVFGVEVDGSYFGEDDTVSSPSPGVDAQSLEADIKAFGSLRGRFGLSLNEFMPYVTAGVGMVDYEVTVDDVTDAVRFSDEDTVFAPVIGAGLEFWTWRNVSFRAEGLYYFIDEDLSFVEPGGPSDTVTIEDLWTARAGMNFRF